MNTKRRVTDDNCAGGLAFALPFRERGQKPAGGYIFQAWRCRILFGEESIRRVRPINVNLRVKRMDSVFSSWVVFRIAEVRNGVRVGQTEKGMSQAR
jgi:hypothetical protein